MHVILYTSKTVKGLLPTLYYTQWRIKAFIAPKAYILLDTLYMGSMQGLQNINW